MAGKFECENKINALFNDEITRRPKLFGARVKLRGRTNSIRRAAQNGEAAATNTKAQMMAMMMSPEVNIDNPSRTRGTG